MANRNFFQIFIVIAGLVSVVGLVMANPVLLPNPVVAVRTTSTSNTDSAFGAEATKIAEEETENGNHVEATCGDPDNCCILDFTHGSCDRHTKPSCDANGCGPVPPTLGFSYAVSGSEKCVNVLDNKGKDTTYDRVFLSHCAESIYSVELYSTSNCDGSHWSQINTAGCYYNAGDIGSFKIIATPRDKREYLGGALMNESDPLSTSAYLSQGNKASVTPADDCFDKETGSYILGCKVERADVAVPNSIQRSVNGTEKGLPRCPELTGDYKHCSLQQPDVTNHLSWNSYDHKGYDRCWLPRFAKDPERVIFVVICPEINNRSVDSSEPEIPTCPPLDKLPKDCTLTSRSATNVSIDLIGPQWVNHTTRAWWCSSSQGPHKLPLLSLVECPVLPHPDECINADGQKSPGCNHTLPSCFDLETGKYHCTTPRDGDSNGPPSLTALTEASSLTPNTSLAARTQWLNCKDPNWCININFGGAMCDIPVKGPVDLSVTEEGNYQCRNIPRHLDIQQVQVTYLEGQLEGHDPTYAELTLFDAPGCTGNNQSVDAVPYCTTMPQGFIILSYRVWIEGACGDDIGPCPGINGGKRGIDDGKRGATPSPFSTISSTFTPHKTAIPHITSRTVDEAKTTFTTTGTENAHSIISHTHAPDIDARSKVTTKKTAPAASVGVTATLSF